MMLLVGFEDSLPFEARPAHAGPRPLPRPLPKDPSPAQEAAPRPPPGLPGPAPSSSSTASMLQLQREEALRQPRDLVMKLVLASGIVQMVWGVGKKSAVQSVVILHHPQVSFLISKLVQNGMAMKLRTEILQDYQIDQRSQLLFFLMGSEHGHLGLCRQGRLLPLVLNERVIGQLILWAVKAGNAPKPTNRKRFQN